MTQYEGTLHSSTSPAERDENWEMWNKQNNMSSAYLYYNNLVIVMDNSSIGSFPPNRSLLSIDYKDWKRKKVFNIAPSLLFIIQVSSLFCLLSSAHDTTHVPASSLNFFSNWIWGLFNPVMYEIVA